MNFKSIIFLCLLLTGLVFRATAVEVQIDTAAIAGSGSNLVDGNADSSVIFNTGKKSPTKVSITVKPDKPELLKAVELTSVSINKWWNIKSVEVYVDQKGDGKFKLIKKEDWYDRGKDNSSKTFNKTIDLGGQEVAALKVVLKRPHPFIWMRLNEIQIIKADGGTVHGKLKLVNCSLKPDAGNIQNLLEEDDVKWSGGKGKPSRVELDVIVNEDHKLKSIELESPSGNKWWYIAHVKIFGVKSGQKTVLLNKDWYNRGNDNSSKKFTLKCEADAFFDKIIIVLSRPHGFINMALSRISLAYQNQVSISVIPRWRAYTVGQLCTGNVKVESSCKNSFGADLKLAIFGKTLFQKKITVEPGKTFFPFEFKVDRQGEFKITPELSGNKENKILLKVSLEELCGIPPHSKYFMSLGTAHGSAQSGALGFNTRHDWNGKFFVKSGKNELKSVLDSGLVRSNCNLPIEVNGPNAYMVNAKGEKLKRHCFHAPHTLSGNVIKNLEYWDGHPGLYEVVYYNEHGYHTWHVKGLCDYNPYTIKLYHKWLADRYKLLDTLNKLYKTKYRSFSQVEPPKEFNGPDARWFDWMEFRRYSYGEYLKDAYRLLKPHLKKTQITPKPINFDYFTVSTANDPWLYKDACDVFGYDIYPFQREGYMDPAMSLDFHRTQVGDKKIKFLESNFEFRRANQTEKTADDMHLLYWPAFLRGLDGMYFYCWYQHWSRNHSGFWLRMTDGVLTPQGRGAAAVVKGVQTLSPILKTGHVLGVQAAVYFPWEEISQTPNVAPISALRGAYKMFTQLHYQTEFVTWHNIIRGDLSKYKVLALPLSCHLRPDVVKKIKEFVKNGGLLIGDYQAGKFDQYHSEQKGLEKVFGIKQQSVYDGYQSFSYGEKEGIRLYRPITKESPFGWKHFPNIKPIPRAEKINAVNAKVLGRFSDKSPAIVTSKYGKGSTLYFASTFFNSYRNYFYTLCTMPTPATRGNEIINVGDREYRKIVKDFLYSHDVKPVADAELYNDDIEDDDSPFLILSLFGDKHCALFGITNWGPHECHNVKVWAKLPFDHVSKLYCMDTTAETLKELPFEVKKNKISAVVPQLNKNVVLIAINDQGPLLVEAVQKVPGGSVTAKLMNYLPEQVKGYIQLRVDGVPEPLSKKVPFALEPGKDGTYELPLGKFDRAKLVDASGKRLPWYVWVVYDGDARSFARVKLPEKMTAP